ncbi:unnamed protein product [Phytomonas sp. EM1]|nr:unnamed protein product [Phytomonas sp. EM1]|eukprot:CCW61072.1 unnamed protein product [Phytomonas sp. isolate EM1]
MGSNTSKQNHSKKSDRSSKKNKNVFGAGVHVGRDGNVDLTGRNMNFLGNKIVNMINNDELHRTATSLTLSHNKLYTIGKEISLLPNIREINLEDNNFERLPKILSVLHKLWKLNASMNPLDSFSGFDVLPALTELRSLVLCKCNLTRVPTPLFQCKFLEELDLSDNPSINLPEGPFVLLTKLTMLKIANCGLKGTLLPENIKNITTLLTLDISGNEFSDFDEDFFGANIAKTLMSLHLRSLDLTSIPQVVVVLRNLQYLDLASNPITTLDVLAGRLVRRLPTPVGINHTSRASEIPMEHEKVSPSMLIPHRLENQGAKEDSILSSRVIHVDAVARNSTEKISEIERDTRYGMDSVEGYDRGSISSRLSMSKVSKAGMIATVKRPILIKKLSLRNCGLRSAPKYFHKLTELEELDLSENYHLNDPNMTLFSLQNLRVLNIVGCPFAENRSKSKNEWFDIAKLQNLEEIEWELWMGNHNLSPYRTRIPIEICGLPLKRINQISLRSGLFVGETIETTINLLRDGYFKVDLSVDDQIVDSYMEAMHIFTRAREFFFPKEIVLSPKLGRISKTISGSELGQCHLRIALSRYIFFLSIQAANYDAVFIPPLDVMIIHYSQITLNPMKYRTDCEAIGGRILDCNYRSFFKELRRNPETAMKAVAASKIIWNLMVRSAYKELTWLMYDFWSRRMQNAFNSPLTSSPQRPSGAQSTPDSNPANDAEDEDMTRLLYLYENPVNQSSEALLADFDQLRKINTASDLTKIIDSSITSHFFDQSSTAFSKTIEDFFQSNDNLIAHQSLFSRLSWDWTRYLKYLALYAYRISMRSTDLLTPKAEISTEINGNSFLSIRPEKSSSIMGPHYDTLQNVSFSNPDKYLPIPPQQTRINSMCISLTHPNSSMYPKHQHQGLPLGIQSAMKRFKVNPVPTIAIALLLYAHRTSHNRYFQTLSLLGIENIDITWEESEANIEQTKAAWKALYEEVYVTEIHDFGYEGNRENLACFSSKGSSVKPLDMRELNAANSAHASALLKESPHNNEHSPFPLTKQEMTEMSFYSPHVKPSNSILVKRTSKKTTPRNKRVLFCTGFEF